MHEDLDAAGHIVSACGLGGVDPIAGCASPPWDVIFGAESTRTYKPQPATYVVAHNLGFTAARQYGLCTIFVPRTRQHRMQ